MCAHSELDTNELLKRAELGDASAVQHLLAKNRRRLRQMVQVRMDQRLLSRVDPSDVVQEALATAHQRLPQYLAERPVAFYPWLRQIALQRLIDLRRRHVESAGRTVNRELPLGLGGSLPDESAVRLAELIATEDSPSQTLIRAELRDRVVEALAQLPDSSREALLLRFAEQLSAREAASVAGISESAFRGRQLRALAQLRDLLDRGSQEVWP